MNRYEIQHLTLCDGWINTWTDDNEEPVTFSTEDEAYRELCAYLTDALAAAAGGDLTDVNLSDYRVKLC
jgi:hypothetical protein